MLRRGGYPLRGATVDIVCGDLIARATSDSNGGLDFEFHLDFPQEQELANSGATHCFLRHRLDDLDSVLELDAQFTSPSEPTAVTTFAWNLPEPQLLPVRVVALAVAFPGAIRIDLALPASLVTPDGRGSRVIAYGRLPLRFARQDHAFIPIGQYFDPVLRVLHMDFLSDMFDDEREPSTGNEALIVLTVPRESSRQ